MEKWRFPHPDALEVSDIPVLLVPNILWQPHRLDSFT